MLSCSKVGRLNVADDSENQTKVELVVSLDRRDYYRGSEVLRYCDQSEKRREKGLGRCLAWASEVRSDLLRCLKYSRADIQNKAILPCGMTSG